MATKRKIDAINELKAAAKLDENMGTSVTSKGNKRKKRPSASKKQIAETIQEISEIPEPVRSSDQQPQRRPKWTNKQRVLVFSSRGIGYRDRHLMNDFKTMMPHSKGESKMNKKEKLVQINEACEMKNCNLTLYFEARKKKDLYMWLAKTPDGPSAKFLVENIHTMDELKMTGNVLKGSRPILSFDKNFDTQPHLQLLRELLAQVFNTPNHHPKSQPFFDRTVTFSIADNRIWLRNFQILDQQGALAEVGPRLTLNLIKIFEGSFRGECLYENPFYVSPNLHRRNIKMAAAGKYINRVYDRVGREQRKPETAYPVEDEADDLFRRADQMDQSGSNGGDVKKPTPKVNTKPKFKAGRNQQRGKRP